MEKVYNIVKMPFSAGLQRRWRDDLDPKGSRNGIDEKNGKTSV